jgi:hypothetical protein
MDQCNPTDQQSSPAVISPGQHVALCTDTTHLDSVFNGRWECFDDMHRALQAYGEERGFRVAHRSKEKFCTPSSASVQQLPTCDGQQQVVSSPSTTSPLSDNDGSSPSVVDDGGVAESASHASSTCMVRLTRSQQVKHVRKTYLQHLRLRPSLSFTRRPL